jgi:PAS domain S-box-containing protein
LNTPQPDNENLRIQKLHEYRILDTSPEQAFDDIVSLATQICGTPFALITLVDTDREWFKAKKGIAANDNPRNGGFCAQTILHQDVMVVSNAENDTRFSTNPLVTSEPNIRFYAGVPVRTTIGEALGTVCVLDTVPRELNEEQIEALRVLARQTGTVLELRRKKMSRADTLAEVKPTEQLLRTTLDAHKEILGSANVSIISTDKQGIIVSFNRTAQRMLGYSEAEVAGKYTPLLFHDAEEIAARADKLSNELGRTIAPGFEAFVAKTRTGNADEREWTYIRKDGSRFQVRLSVTTLYGPDDNITGFLGIAIDITRRKTAEDRLKNSEQFTRAVLDALSKQFCVLDADGNILAVNKPWLDFEREHDSDTQTLEIGQNYLALLDAGLSTNRGGDTFAEGIRSVLDGTKSGFSLEYSCHTRSVQQWFAGKVIPFPDQELGTVIVIHENISDHKRLEHRFRHAVESAPNAIVMINESGTIVMVNSQTETSFGYSRTELVGQPVELLVPERFRKVHIGFRQTYFAVPVSRPMGAGRDLYGLRKDGTEFPVEIGLSLIDSHEETLVLSTIVDITERKQAEAALKTSESALKEAQRLSGLGGWKWDIRTGVHSWSEEIYRIFGRDQALPPAIYPEVQQYFTSDSWVPLAAAVEKGLAEGVSYECDAEVVRPDGTHRWIVARGEATRDVTRNVINLHGTVQDITERKNANDKLKEALNEKEMLLKEVYHRVKNNLQVVSSLINLQARNVKNEATVDLLKQSADRIKAMALLHEKLYQSKDLARIDFNAYIHSLVDHLLFGYGAHSGKINISMSIDDVFLDVDTAIPCGLIINELLSNILKHAFPDDRYGEIGITFTQDQGEFILVITDNGIGFPPGLDFNKSASLGLQLVATLTSQLMGDMTLDQTGGSTFTLRFTNTF